MTFDEVLALVLALLQQEKRVSYRALKRRFDLDDDYLEDLKSEIIDAKQLAVDENNKVLAWAAPNNALFSYTPKHLTEQLLTTRSALEGERKQVTVLFCDLVDSSGLAQQVDLEAMHQVMDQVLRLLAAAVHRYEGTVNQYLGDGLMALFGAPIAQEDHAFRAIQAALAMQETISGYNSQLQRDYGITVRLRVGLNTGLVVVGRIGDDLRMDYTAIGNTTNLAARVQSSAKPGTILITDATYRLIQAYVHVNALGPIEIKGQRQPVVVYEVIGRQRWRSRLEISAERGLTALVGRQRELALLHACLARVQMGQGQVVGIVGEAGIGKARLLYEFRRTLGDKHIIWLTGHCTAHSQSTPYGPILHILRENFDIEEGDNALQVQAKLRQGLSRLNPNLTSLLPFLQALFTLPGAHDGLKHLDPKDKRQQIFEALYTLATSASQRQPQVLVHENLHWIDRTSEDCLARLVERLEDFPILVLTTHRPGYTVPWTDKPYYTQIALDDLTTVEAKRMVTTLLGTAPPTGLMALIQEKSGGNPAFIEEVFHAFLERGLLQRQGDVSAWARDAQMAFPETIQDLARARLDQLEESVKRTVQTAAVIGREFSFHLLKDLCESPVQEHLETLKRMALIYESRFFPELAYRFKHAVTQDVAYQGLLGQRRQELHGAIGQAIEAAYVDNLDEQIAILAHHYAHSTRHDKALAYARLAGDQADRLYAPDEAAAYYAQALTLARAMPPSPQAQRAQVDAALKLAAVDMGGREMDRNQENIEQALTLAEALQDEPYTAQAHYWLGRLHYARGNPHAAITHARKSLAIADRLDADALSAPPVNLMGRVYWQLSDYAKSSQMMVRSTEQMHQLGNTIEEATAAGFAGRVFGLMGEFDPALAYTERGLRLAQTTQSPFARAATHHYRGIVQAQRGAWEQAIIAYQTARDIAQQAGDRFRVYTVNFWEGRAQTTSGNVDQGRILLEEGLAFATQIGTKFDLPHGKANLAACLLAQGDATAVPVLCQEAIDLAAETGDQFFKALAYRTRAEAEFALDASNRQQVEDAIQKAIRLQQNIGASPEQAHSYVCYAHFYRAWGDTGKAKAYLMMAISMFRHMEMTWALAQIAPHMQAML